MNLSSVAIANADAPTCVRRQKQTPSMRTRKLADAHHHRMQAAMNDLRNDSSEDLNRRFAVPGVAEVIAGNGNLPRIRLTTPAAAAEIYLHGAQVTSWQPAGAE